MEVIEVNLSGTVQNFWECLRIYYNHPNSINKQIVFSEHIFGAKLKSVLNSDECLKLCYEFSANLVKDLKTCENIKNERILEFVPARFVNTAFTYSKGIYFFIRRLFPKTCYEGDAFYEFFFLDKQLIKMHICTQHLKQDGFNPDSMGVVEKYPLSVLKFKYIQLSYKRNTLQLFYAKGLGEKGINWLKVVFVKKIIKIMRNTTSEIDKNNKISDRLHFTSKIDLVQYYKLYEQLKSKYAKSLIENWSENTDPQKFVFEDIGIATYLMLLWNNGNIPEQLSDERKVKFVDLGCGNGLLVHILNSEGHLGVGLDIRRRKIWDTYPLTTVLKEETIIPTMDAVYPNADWLIGNHSDELTAWIPIMARKSNKNCQYFVLPCCPFQLNGNKFQRRNSGLSSYLDFINYVKSVSEVCEFETSVDKLRIPSTKRICLIGLNKSEMSEEYYNSLNTKIINFVNEEFGTLNNDPKSKLRATGKSLTGLNTFWSFKVRKPKDEIRNCTKLPQQVIDEVLRAVMKTLLREQCPCVVVRNKTSGIWNRGGRLPISELARGVDWKLLKQLKVQCKGLQTLLKNHNSVFTVNSGCAQFRCPKELLRISLKLLTNGDKSRWKKKSCWFYFNHPDKCPLSDDMCSYSHDS